jgi:AcrR family transcriptional regulator
MARPSQNVDQLLLDAGAQLLPVTGCKGLSVRQLAEHAGVNLGMFHYHFKSKDNFLSAVLQRTYEEMFAQLVLHVSQEKSPIENLREVIRLLARFASKHRALLVMLMQEAMTGEAVPLAFLRRNLPRHIGIIARLIKQAQKQGAMVKAPLPQVLAFLVGAVAAPLMIGTALQRPDLLPEALAAALEKAVLSNRAIDQRIEFVLTGLAAQ